MMAPAEEKLSRSVARLWHSFDQLNRRYAARFSGEAQAILSRELNRAAEVYPTAGAAAAAASVEPESWATFLDRVWLTMVPAGGLLIADWLAKAGQTELLAAAGAWLALHGRGRAGGIADTSRAVIFGLIAAGVEAGETEGQIAARIRAATRTEAPARALTIARTEVHAATNYGSFVAASDSQVVKEKIWIATPDGRARDTHAAASGQKRKLDEPFMVGGESVMYPGSGSPANTVNCRCTLGYAVIRWRRAA